MAQPQNISSKVIDQLNDYQSGDKSLTEIDRARITRDIESLKRVDLSSGLMAYGIYYACLGDEDNSLSNHEKSLAASGKSLPCLVNYGISLTHFLRFGKAFEVFLEVLKKDPADQNVLFFLSQLAFFTGNVSKFREALDIHLKAAQESKAMELPSVLSAARFFEDVKSLGVPENDLLKMCSHLERVYSGHCLMPLGAISSLNDADGHKYLNVEIKINCPGEQLAIINDEFFTLISEDFSISSWNKVVFSFIYGSGSRNIFQDIF